MWFIKQKSNVSHIYIYIYIFYAQKVEAKQKASLQLMQEACPLAHSFTRCGSWAYKSFIFSNSWPRYWNKFMIQGTSFSCRTLPSCKLEAWRQYVSHGLPPTNMARGSQSIFMSSRSSLKVPVFLAPSPLHFPYVLPDCLPADFQLQNKSQKKQTPIIDCLA